MKIIPVLTEKSLHLAKEGKYTFWVEKNMTKREIRQVIDEIFGVKSLSVRTINVRGGVRKNVRGQKITTPRRKKAIVTLPEKEKIDLFEEKK
mgnify:CR=1 FL=1